MEDEDARGVGRQQKSIVAYVPKNESFDKVISKTDTTQQDYWFVWSGDFEPIRLTYKNSEIISVLHRIHWVHNVVDNPYMNDEKRIESFFYPICHLPVIRKRKKDVNFFILTRKFLVNRLCDYDLVDEDIPNYFISKGKKDRHFFSMEYQGWTELE